VEHRLYKYEPDHPRERIRSARGVLIGCIIAAVLWACLFVLGRWLLA
jgi:hypothetical protein